MSMKSASTRWPIRVDNHMPKLCSHAVEALEQTITADHTATDACANREVNEVMMTFPSTILPFAQSGHVRVIIQIERHSKMLGQIWCQRKVFPFGNVWCGKDGPSMRVKWAW